MYPWSLAYLVSAVSRPHVYLANPMPGLSKKIIVKPHSLIVGENILAVELHRAAAATGAGFGMSFEAIVTASPATMDTPALALNEVVANPGIDQVDWVELMNRGKCIAI